MRLEVAVVPVSNVDRAKAFRRERAAFVVDHDTQVSDAVRVVQLTPPGSACSIMIGTGLPAMPPGSLRGLQLVVPDMESARSDLIARGLDVGEVGILGRPGRPGFAFAHFEDPDGNSCAIQEVRPV